MDEKIIGLAGHYRMNHRYIHCIHTCEIAESRPAALTVGLRCVQLPRAFGKSWREGKMSLLNTYLGFTGVLSKDCPCFT